MSKEPEIYNGPHQGEPIGQLPSHDGGIVLVWSREPLDVLATMITAVGQPPPPPEILVGGHFEVFRQFALDKPISDDGPPRVVYDPSQDVINQVVASMYASQIEAWNTRAKLIYETGLALLGKGGSALVDARRK